MIGVIGFVLLISFSQSYSKEVCYDHLGCFSDGAPWTGIFIRPGVGLPQAPEVINTRHCLYTRENTDNEFEIMADHQALLDASNFNGSKKTVFIIHGFADNTYEQWVQDMITALLLNEDINVIAVDWSSGAASYLDAAANVRLVGAEITRLINYLTNVTEMSLDRIHLVGHDLGAHAASYTGTNIRHISRITGLDPAALFFEGTDSLVYLEKSDADIVDIIHTDASGLLFLGFGMVEDSGHVNFYPNSGKHQPKCDDTIGKLINSINDLIHLNFSNGAFQEIACSHFRAIYYFTESIRSPCGFISMPCSSQDKFDKEECMKSCQTKESCQHLGYHIHPSGPLGNMYLTTEDHSPFCDRYVTISVNINQEQKTTNGKLTAKLYGTNGPSTDIVIIDGKIHGGNIIYDHLETPGEKPDTFGDVTSVEMTYKEHFGLFNSKTLDLYGVEVTILQGEMEETRTSFEGASLQSGDPTVLHTTDKAI